MKILLIMYIGYISGKIGEFLGAHFYKFIKRKFNLFK